MIQPWLTNLIQYSVATLDNIAPVVLQQLMFAHGTLTAVDT